MSVNLMTSGLIHGMSYTRFYGIWQAMKARCLDSKHKKYDRYGGRGISIDPAWISNFINFKNDMYSSYLEKCKIIKEEKISINRINNNGNYEKNNCEWSSAVEQMSNTNRNRKFIAINPLGIEYTHTNQNLFAREYNLCSKSISRILNGKRKSHKGWRFKNA